MKDQDVLEHETRRYLLDYISRNPETTFRMLKSVFRINEGTLTYHLKRLIREDMIVQKKKGRERCYVSLDTIHGRGHDQAGKGREKVYQLISDNPGMTRKELLRRTRMTGKELSQCIYDLRTESMIWKVKKGKKVAYEVITSRKVHDEMVLILTDRYLKDEIDLETLKRTKEALDRLVQ